MHQKTLLYLLLSQIIIFCKQEELTYPLSSIEIDAIACIIVSDEGIIPVYLSDIWLPSALGVQTTLEERIIRMNWIARGADRGVKMQNDGSFQEYAEEYLDMLQQQRGVTRDDLKKMCHSAGFTMNDIKKELNQQFLLQQSVETILVSSGCMNVSSEEIKKYYDEHPLFIPTKYTYSQTEIINNVVDKETKIIKTATADELPEDMLFIKDLEIGESRKYHNTTINKEYKIKLIRKTQEQLISLSDRYENILRYLQQIKYKANYVQYTLKFLSDSDNVFFHDKDLCGRCIDFIKNQAESQEDTEPKEYST